MVNDIMKVIVTRDDCIIDTAVQINGKQVFNENHSFCDEKHAEGYFADIFHFLTGNRYSEPTKGLTINRYLNAKT